MSAKILRRRPEIPGVRESLVLRTRPQRVYRGGRYSGHARTHNGDVHGDVNHNYYGSDKERTSAEKISDSLLLTTPEDDREEIVGAKGARIPGTCEWILQHDAFFSWRAGEFPALWINGSPGKGKTMLSVFLTEELGKCAAETETFQLVYFFCSHQGRNDVVDLLRSLLWQLLQAEPEHSKVLEPWFNTRERTDYCMASRDILWSMLNKILAAHRSIVYCVLDGLDELESSSITWFCDKVLSMYDGLSQNGGSGKLHVLIVSRDMAALSSLPQIRLDDTDANLGRDIEIFIDASIRQLSRRLNGATNEFYETMRQGLLTRSHGTFLWLGFAVRDLLQQRTATEALETLQSLPEGISQYYERMFANIKGRHRERSIRLLLWVVLASRPLHLSELAAGLLTPMELEHVPLSQEAMIRDRIAMCGSLLHIYDGKVFIVHQSACQYLFDHAEACERSSATEFVGIETMQLEILETCMRSLNSRAMQKFIRGESQRRRRFRGSHRRRRSSSSQDERGNRAQLLDADPLLEYSVTSWMDHARALSVSSATSFFTAPFFLSKANNSRENWADLYSDLIYESIVSSRTPLLHLACLSGLSVWVEVVLDPNNHEALFAPEAQTIPSLSFSVRANTDHIADESTIVQKQVSFAPPQTYDASQASHGSISSLPLSETKEIDFDERDEERYTPLEMAILGGARHSVLLLLDNGANVNSRRRSQFDKSALFVAVQRGQREIVELLLDRGADVNWRSHGSRHTWTCLFAAVANDDHAVVDILLCHGANEFVLNGGNAARNHGKARTAYEVAVGKGHTRIVTLLTSHAVDQLTKSSAPLDYIIRHAEVGNLDLAIALTQCSALGSYSFSDEHFRTFILRFRWGTESVKAADRAFADLLLSRGASVNATYDDRLATLLHLCHNPAIANYLLDRDADLEARDKDGRTPLHCAGEDTLRLLVARGADVHARDSSGMTPLHSVASSSFGGLETLLNHGAVVDAQDEMGRTALHYAVQSLAKKYFWETAPDDVRLLLKNGANANMCDVLGQTPLHTVATIPLIYLIHTRDGDSFTDSLYPASFRPLLSTALDTYEPTAPAIDFTYADAPSAAPGFVAGYSLLEELMIAHGADPSIKNMQGLTPRDLMAHNVVLLQSVSAEFAAYQEDVWLREHYGNIAKEFWDGAVRIRDEGDILEKHISLWDNSLEGSLNTGDNLPSAVAESSQTENPAVVDQPAAAVGTMSGALSDEDDGGVPLG